MAEISIVVPVYKVEKYLDRCMQSLLHQTFLDYEIILVDDGSPDCCPVICDRYAQKYPFIKVVHKENGGLSSARNAGMKIASGKYIGFVDSDDTILPNMYQRMHEEIEKHSADFAMCDYERILEDGSSFLKTTELEKGFYEKEKIIQTIFPKLIMDSNLEYGPLLSVCHCLYRLDFLKEHDIRFDEEVRWSEDNIFSAFVGYHANCFCYLKGEGLYRYYQNTGTITTSYRQGAWNVYKTMNHHLRDFFSQKTNYDFENQINVHLIYYACNCIGQTNRLEPKQMSLEMHSILNDPELQKAFQSVRYDEIGWKLKIQLWLMKHKQVKLLKKMITNRKK